MPENNGLTQFKCCEGCTNFNCKGTQDIVVQDLANRYGKEKMSCHSSKKYGK